MGTLRQQIIELLQNNSMDLVALSRTLRLSEKETASHIPHIAKSVTSKGGTFTVLPAMCRDCGYSFRDRQRLSPPSRCPRCRQNRIDGPWYEVSGLRLPVDTLIKFH